MLPEQGRGRRFGSSALKVDASIFAMVTRDHLVVKLPRTRVFELIAAGTGAPFTGGKTAPMKEWLIVTTNQPSTWLVFGKRRSPSSVSADRTFLARACRRAFRRAPPGRQTVRADGHLAQRSAGLHHPGRQEPRERRNLVPVDDPASDKGVDNADVRAPAASTATDELPGVSDADREWTA